MKIKVLKSEKCLCPSCMEEHEVKTVLVEESSFFKEEKICYEANYMLCDNTKELFANEQQLSQNDLNLKNAYRKKHGLLTSEEIVSIRSKYNITQNDLCLLLGWGGKTIARYEGHQIQDKAHDSILKKIDQDPEWFIELLDASNSQFKEATYKRYLTIATAIYEAYQDNYLRKSIEAAYYKYQSAPVMRGNQYLSLDKVIDVIRYFASSKKITDLYKVKLMKLMWYADTLSYRLYGHAITGLVYQALPMGAVPIGHNSIMDLKGVPYEEEDIGEMSAYHFCLKKEESFPALIDEDKKILDMVIEKLGGLSKREIVDFMHRERAYIETKPKDIISFEYAQYLQI